MPDVRGSAVKTSVRRRQRKLSSTFFPLRPTHSPALRLSRRTTIRAELLSTRQLRGCLASTARRNTSLLFPPGEASHPSCDWLARPITERNSHPVVAGAPTTRVPRLLGGAADRQQSTERFFASICVQPTPHQSDQPSRFSGDTSIRSGRCSSS